MCGIFGMCINRESKLSANALKYITKHLFLLSESRGKEASGLSILAGDTISTYKDAKSAFSLIGSKEYRNLFDRVLGKNASAKDLQTSFPIAIIGHSRLVTNGAAKLHENNQPVITDGAIGIHNGIIVNQDYLWKQYPEMKRSYQVDSEVIFRLIRMFHQKGTALSEATQKTFQEIQGIASVAVLFDDLDYLLLATNNGSLYQCANETKSCFIFASERYILEQLTKKRFIHKLLGQYSTSQVPPGEARLINITDLSVNRFSLETDTSCLIQLKRTGIRRQINDILPKPNGEVRSVVFDTDMRARRLVSIAKLFRYDNTYRDKLWRCARCILPETIPFIEFDGEGVCNFCRNYSELKFYGRGGLEQAVVPYRSKNGEPDCVVGVSGGRDSTFALHYVKTVLKMNPVAYTYDWGMVTDLARRNISRICGKLGIEHILVSADITRKREYIRKNVCAWLERPRLGMIPLFMAGDKQYFYYHYKVCNQIGAKLAIQGENMLERTDFKSGFAGVRPFNLDPYHSNTLSMTGAIKLAMYYGKEYIMNAKYINASLVDTFFAYLSYFVINRNYINLYNYIPWVEDEVVSILIKEYDWELATDTKSTWRIGDGTASFYNYIYLTLAGFTENDTFRSNQIREGMITREEALKLVEKENEPRFESIQWYCNTIGIDFEDTIKRINSAPKLYMY